MLLAARILDNGTTRANALGIANRGPLNKTQSLPISVVAMAPTTALAVHVKHTLGASALDFTENRYGFGANVRGELVVGTEAKVGAHIVAACTTYARILPVLTARITAILGRR